MIEDNVTIGANVLIEKGAVIKEGAVIPDNTVIGKNEIIFTIPSVRMIPIPKRDHGYSNFDSTVIMSQVALDKFLKEFKGRIAG